MNLAVGPRRFVNARIGSELDGSQPMMVSSGSPIDLKLYQPPLCWLPGLPPLLRDARYLRTG